MRARSTGEGEGVFAGEANSGEVELVSPDDGSLLDMRELDAVGFRGPGLPTFNPAVSAFLDLMVGWFLEKWKDPLKCLPF
ncbi:hypothetical protein MXD62_31455 [Frankia sp. Mgl5]|nr:hypothetical protein [Frankia sp. Mgl5]